MAIARKLERTTIGRNTAQTELRRCTYAILNNPDGKYLQIDSYGSVTRKFPEGKSQSIRFSPKAVAQLREILSKEL